MEPGNQPIRLAHLDALRGVAIVMVAFFHAYARWGEIEPFAQDARLVRVFASSWLGVELFFAISGFVILMSLHRSRGFGQFIGRRWLRLFPAMLVASLLIYAASPLMPYRPAGQPTAGSLLPGLLFIEPEVLGDLAGRRIDALEGAFWSLYVEVRFYLLAGFAFFVLRDRNLLSVLAVFAAFVASGLLAGHSDGGWIGRAHSFLAFWGAPYYGWFLVGVFGYRYYAEGRGILLVAAAAAGLAASGLVIQEYGASRLMIATLAFVLALFIGALWSPRFARLLANPVLLFLGFVSYPLYLVHENFVTGNAIALSHLAPGLNPALLPLPFLAAAVVIAYAIALVEPHLRDAFRGVGAKAFGRFAGRA
jgi:peptidoglycan/LPS O-acetylase OafA/YrhL